MIRTSLFALGLCAVLPGVAAAQTFPPPSAHDFAIQSAVSNNFAIESSLLALRRSDRPEIRRYAERVVYDRRRANDALGDAAFDADVPIASAALDGDHRDRLRDLERAAPGDFNGDYLDAQADAQGDTIDLLSDYARGGREPALVDYAVHTLPMVRDDQRLIRQIE